MLVLQRRSILAVHGWRPLQALCSTSAASGARSRAHHPHHGRAHPTLPNTIYVTEDGEYPPADDGVRHTIATARGNMSCTVSNPDAPLVLVAIHGGPGSARDFRYLNPALAPHVCVVAVDLPGFGASDASVAESWDPASLSESVMLVVDDLNLRAKPLFVLGHSIGGPVALQFAATHQSWLSGLVLFAAFGLRPHRAIRPFPFMQWVGRTVATPMGRAVLSPITRKAFVSLGFSRSLKNEDSVYPMVRLAHLSLEQQAKNAAAVRGFPSFFVYSENDRQIEAAVSAELGKALEPQVTVCIQRGGHNPQKSYASNLAKLMVPWMETAARKS